MSSDIVVPLAVLTISLVIGVGGIVFMFREKVVYDRENNRTEIELPLFGKLQTNYPAIAAFFISAGLAAFMADLWEGEPKRIPITASIKLDGQRAEDRSQLFVGVIPGSALRLETVKPNDDLYEIEIPVIAGELSYTGIAQIRSRGFVDTDMGTVLSKSGGLWFDASLRRDNSGNDNLSK